MRHDRLKDNNETLINGYLKDNVDAILHKFL